MTEVVDFGGLQIAFDDRLLRPRTWTEHHSRWAADLLPQLPAGDVLELCSGAGHIGLLAVVDSDRRLVAVDVNPVAGDFTLRNAAGAGLADRLEMRTGRITDVLAPDEVFPLIVADPPWVPRSETDQFPADPLLAIDGGDDGLFVVRECLDAIAAHLARGGVALLQVAPGAAQADAVSLLLAGSPLVAGERRSFDRGVLLRIDCPEVA